MSNIGKYQRLCRGSSRFVNRTVTAVVTNTSVLRKYDLVLLSGSTLIK